MAKTIDPKKHADPAIHKMLEYCNIRHLPSKQIIIRPGDSADTLFYLIDGSATISMADDESNDIILGYLNGGDFIGETGLFIPQPQRQVTVRTRTPCTIAEISYDRINKLAEFELKAQYPGILKTIAAHISQRLLQTTRKVGHLAFMDAAGRIASTLLDLCKQPDAMTHPDGMQIKISRTELGRIVGCSREMVGRVIKNMEQQGLISAKGKTIVVFGARD
ncbi:MAG: cAMP-activated global transcriptional regulator CRP [Gammaproteobacteria bacterium]|nr:cAMP-activated global transcriptional regulator CRP [Gammaproteobacteria bacterium]MDH5729629.1 cAMP-activated global transcriptional regulator CRP [Gammaproteobacteria bacterium]